MREFSWRYFTLTGNIDAYLLYKGHQRLTEERRRQNPQTTDVDVDET